MPQKKKPQVCWVVGNYVQRKGFIEKIKSSGSYDIHIFDGDSSLEFVEQQLESQPGFGDPRLIVINDLPDSKSTKQTILKRLLKALSSLPPRCSVVLNNFSDTKPLNEFIKDHGTKKEYPDEIAPNEAIRLIRSELAEKNISTDDVEFILASIVSPYRKKNVKFDDLLLLLKKIKAFIGDRKKINREDIESICFDQSEFIIWNLLNTLDSRVYSKSIALLNKAIELQSNSKEAIVSTLYMMLWHYKMLLLIKEGNVQNPPEKKLINEIQGIGKLKRQEDSKSGFQQKSEADVNEKKQEKPIYSEKAIQVAIQTTRAGRVNFGRGELFLIVGALEDALLKVRSTDSDVQCFICIDSLFLGICQKIDWRSSEFLRQQIIV